jgi:hypothetical protein
MRLLISRLRNSHLIYKNVIVYLLIKHNRKCNETLFHRKIKTKKLVRNKICCIYIDIYCEIDK